jgi:hypothetical protein
MPEDGPQRKEAVTGEPTLTGAVAREIARSSSAVREGRVKVASVPVMEVLPVIWWSVPAGPVAPQAPVTLNTERRAVT